MNNIRKIIEERLDNARNDIKECISEKKLRELLGTVQAYQDCLNLIPAPRTEQEILNDFEKLGYKVVNLYNHPLIEMSKYNEDYGSWECIIIHKGKHTYEKNLMSGDSVPITMQEHKLLNELFEVLGDE